MQHNQSFPIILLLSFIGLFSNALSQELAVDRIADSLKKNVNTVVRYHHTTIEVHNDHSMSLSYEWAITVLNKQGDEQVSTANSYSKSQKISHMSARLYDAAGEEMDKLKSTDIIDISAVTSSLFVDDRIKYYSYSPGSYPYTLVYKIEIKSENTAFLPDWNPLAKEFQSVELNTYTFTWPESWKLSRIERNFGNFGVDKQEGPGSYKLKLENKRPVEREYAAPPSKEYLPYATLTLDHFQLENVKGTASTWSEWGNWYYNNLLGGWDQIPEKTRQEVLALTAGLTDSVEMARRIYSYVQQKTRYVSIQIGIGGWKPMAIASVDELKYGECKALSFYTSCLLRMVGLPANYTIAYAGDYPISIDTNEISVQGNHVFVSIPLKDTTIWLETTNQYCPFGYLGDFTDNRIVLSVSDKSTKLVRTPAYADTANKQITLATIALDAEGNINASVEIASSGIQYDWKYHLELLQKEDQEKHYQQYWSYLQFLKLNSIQFMNDKRKIQYTETIALEAKKYATMSGERMMIPAMFFHRNDDIPPKNTSRKQPIDIARGYYDDDTYTLELPQGFAIEALPKADLSTEFGNYKLETEIMSDGKLKIRRSILIKSGRFAPESYEAWVRFKKDISRYDQSKIILIKKSL